MIPKSKLKQGGAPKTSNQIAESKKNIQAVEDFAQQLKQFNLNKLNNNLPKNQPKIKIVERARKPAQAVDEDISKILNIATNGQRIDRNVFNNMKSDLNIMKQQLLALKHQLDAPLQTLGMGLTSTIAQCIHMFVNPGGAKRMCIPSDKKASVFGIDWVPLTSIPLWNGKSNVIITPDGPFQEYNSTNGEIIFLPGPNSGWEEPELIERYINNASDKSRVLIYVAKNNQDGSLVQTCDQFFAISPTAALGVGTNLSIDTAAEYVGGTLTITYDDGTTQVENIQQQQICLTRGGAGMPGQQVVNLNDAPHDIVDLNFQAHNLIPKNTILTTRFYQTDLAGAPVPATYIDYIIPASLNTYFARVAPNVQSLDASQQLTDGFINSMSGLLTDDAADINNGGYIQAITKAGVLNPPNNVNFNAWLSQQQTWKYRGRLKDGAYQIYIPNSDPALLRETGQVIPWLNDNAWSMVYLVDLSQNAGGPPSAAQCHIQVDGNYQTSSMSNILPSGVTIEDPYYKAAVTFLREVYCPCCNPDHKDAMAKWIANTLNSVISKSSDFVKSKVTEKNVKAVLGSGEQFAKSLLNTGKKFALNAAGDAAYALLTEAMAAPAELLSL
jgi:hypothetical protein